MFPAKLGLFLSPLWLLSVCVLKRLFLTQLLQTYPFLLSNTFSSFGSHV